MSCKVYVKITKFDSLFIFIDLEKLIKVLDIIILELCSFNESTALDNKSIVDDLCREHLMLSLINHLVLLIQFVKLVLAFETFR